MPTFISRRAGGGTRARARTVHGVARWIEIAIIPRARKCRFHRFLSADVSREDEVDANVCSRLAVPPYREWLASYPEEWIGSDGPVGRGEKERKRKKRKNERSLGTAQAGANGVEDEGGFFVERRSGIFRHTGHDGFNVLAPPRGGLARVLRTLSTGHFQHYPKLVPKLVSISVKMFK